MVMEDGITVANDTQWVGPDQMSALTFDLYPRS